MARGILEDVVVVTLEADGELIECFDFTAPGIKPYFLAWYVWCEGVGESDMIVTDGLGIYWQAGPCKSQDYIDDAQGPLTLEQFDVESRAEVERFIRQLVDE